MGGYLPTTEMGIEDVIVGSKGAVGKLTPYEWSGYNGDNLMRRQNFVILVLSFAGCVCGLTDDNSTIGLYHMESTLYFSGNYYVLDDDIYTPGRDNHLLLGSASLSATVPGLIDGGYDGSGKALNLRGQTDACEIQWAGGDSISIEFWFKADYQSSNPAQTLVYLSGLIGADELRMEGTYNDLPGGNTRLKFFRPGGYGNNWIPIQYDGLWHYVYLYVDDTESRLTYDSLERVTDVSTDYPFEDRSNTLFFGITKWNSRNFVGLIDELKITIPSNYAEPVCGDWGYLAADINMDCYVNLLDLIMLCEQWMNFDGTDL